MNKYIKDFLGLAIGIVSVLSGLLTLILCFAYLRDGFPTETPILLFVSIGVFFCTLGLAWKYPVVRSHLATCWIPTNWI